MSSGVGIAHLPNQKHRIVANKGATFTLMVCGKSNTLSSPEKRKFLILL